MLARTLIISLIIAFYATPGSSQADEPEYSEAFRLIEVWLDAQQDYEQLPGISAAVVRDQEIIWSDAFGKANPEMNLETKPTTLCSICSISKLFTSVAVMKLYDEGKVRLDDRIEDLLPWYDLPQQYRDSGPVTIRSLLSHSSGLPRESAHPYWTGPDFPFPTQEEIREGLSTQETLYPSSTNYQYSNLGLTLLGEVVEEVSGMPYEEYVRQNILDPLGLADTRPRMPEELYGKQLAIGYSSITRNGDREKVNFFNANGITPAAGYSSNVLDLGKFASWQFRLYDTSTVEILKPSTLKYMHRVQWMDKPGMGWARGLGFGVYTDNGTTLVGHGGSCPGYRSVLQLDTKKKMAYVAMINASGTNPGKYTSGIRQIMQKAKKAGNEDELTESVNLEQYAGHYTEQPWWGEMYIMPWGDQLVSLRLPTDNPGNAMTFFRHIDGDTFRRIRDDDTLGEALIFERDANGHVNRVSQHGNYSVKIER